MSRALLSSGLTYSPKVIFLASVLINKIFSLFPKYGRTTEPNKPEVVLYLIQKQRNMDKKYNRNCKQKYKLFTYNVILFY